MVFRDIDVAHVASVAPNASGSRPVLERDVLRPGTKDGEVLPLRDRYVYVPSQRGWSKRAQRPKPLH